MKNFKVRHLQLRSGEEIQLRETPEGQFVCPVCGFTLGGDEAPYYLAWTVLPNGEKGDVFAVASFNICPSCNTEYGFDDAVEKGESVVAKWEELRAAWLQQVGEDNETAKTQLLNLDPN